MQILCTEKDQEFSLDPLILHNNPLVLSMNPFIGPMQLKFKIISKGFVQGICFGAQGSNITYVSHYQDIPEGTYLALFQEGDGYVLFFCLSHQDVTTTLNRGPILQMLSGQSREANKVRPVLVALRGDSVKDVFQRLFSLSLENTGKVGKLLKEKPSLPPCFGKLGWNSRLAFRENISHENILEAVHSIKKLGFSIGFVIIEEGWQTLSTKGLEIPALHDFEADQKRFPHGLKGLTKQLHDEGIDQVGVWHGIMGYKGGIHAHLAKGYDFPPDSFGRYFPGYDLGRTFQFFYDYYSYLKEQGITFIKVGDQDTPPYYCRKGMDVTRLYKNLQTAIQGASSLHFNSGPLNTECLRNENLFYWTSSLIANCGKIHHPVSHSHVCNVIREYLTHSLWLQHLMHPDFDAWPTGQQASETLAIFHALSGTFNVISDPPGHHHSDLLKKCVLPSGTLVKADAPLTLCEESIFVDPLVEQKIYKAHTMKGPNGIFSLFHLGDPKKILQGSLSPLEIPQLKGALFALFSYRHGFLGLIEKAAVHTFKLKNGQSDILTLAPIQEGIGVIGCHLLFLAPGLLIRVHLESESLHLTTAFAAPLLLYCERNILEIRRNGQAIPWALDPKRHLLSIDPGSEIIETPSYYTVQFE